VRCQDLISHFASFLSCQYSEQVSLYWLYLALRCSGSSNNSFVRCLMTLYQLHNLYSVELHTNTIVNGE